jgi:hypothetical protein
MKDSPWKLMFGRLELEISRRSCLREASAYALTVNNPKAVVLLIHDIREWRSHCIFKPH